MRRRFQNPFFRSDSGNTLKSKTCPELSRRIQNLKCLGISVIAFVLVVCGALAQAQQQKRVYRIGFLSAGFAPDPVNQHQLKSFLLGLQDFGYVEGKNVIIEYRHAEGKPERLAELAAGLVSLKVDVIVTGGNEPVLAAKNATQTIPIVMAFSGDPVGTGFVASLARPGGNITGLTSVSQQLVGKRLELLKEVVSRLLQVAVLWNPENPIGRSSLKEMEEAARTLGLNLQMLEAQGLKGLDGAFSAVIKARSGALVVLPGGFANRNRNRIVELAMKNRLPGMYPQREFVEAGGLMSYGAVRVDEFRRAAIYVDKILKGAKPADLPVEQPTKFEFFINLKAAKQIGLTIPPNVLVRADRVIR